MKELSPKKNTGANQIFLNLFKLGIRLESQAFLCGNTFVYYISYHLEEIMVHSAPAISALVVITTPRVAGHEFILYNEGARYYMKSTKHSVCFLVF